MHFASNFGEISLTLAFFYYMALTVVEMYPRRPALLVLRDYHAVGDVTCKFLIYSNSTVIGNCPHFVYGMYLAAY